MYLDMFMEVMKGTSGHKDPFSGRINLSPEKAVRACSGQRCSTLKSALLSLKHSSSLPFPALFERHAVRQFDGTIVYSKA
jgi:hypothetical protein